MEKISAPITIEDPENLHLCFELEDKTYAMSAKNVLEVTTLPSLNEPQKLPEYIVGILNYNDLYINVIDVRKVFSLPQRKYELHNKVIILKGEESLIAMIVDKVTEFFTLVPHSVQRVMGESFNDIVRAFYKFEDKTINIIDIQKLEEEIKKVHFHENTTNYTELFPSDEESVGILEKRRREIAAPPSMNIATSFLGKDQYLIFRINGHTYCIYSLFVKELINPRNYPVTKIPYTPDFILGIINLKGNFYTVIDLKKFIGFDENGNENEDGSKDKKIIVIETSELKFAFLVDEISDIINITEDNIETRNDMMLDSLYIKAEAYIDKKVYNILNLDKLINDEKLYVNNSN